MSRRDPVPSYQGVGHSGFLTTPDRFGSGPGSRAVNERRERRRVAEDGSQRLGSPGRTPKTISLPKRWTRTRTKCYDRAQTQPMLVPQTPNL